MDMKELYSPEALPRLEKKIKRERIVIWALAGLTLAVCIALCCLTDTANAEQMELAAILCSTAGGWLVIYRRLFGLLEARYELQHARHLLEAPRETLRGRLGITRERLRIKNSIRIRVLLLEDGGKTRRLKVNETRVKSLRPYDGKQVRIELAGGYVAGIGGADADS